MFRNEPAPSGWPLTAGVTTLMMVAGLLQALSLAWPFEGAMKGEPQGWLQLISFVVLAYTIDRSKTRQQTFVQGWIFSVTWLVGCTWWLFISMHRYGDMPAPLAALAVFVLAAGLALIYGVACTIFHALTQNGCPVLARASAFAAVWVLAEMMRGTLWTGFPWGAMGYAHVDSVLRHWAPWGGVYGLCALSAFGAMTIGAERREARAASRLTQLGWVLVCVVVGALGWWTPDASKLETHQSKQALSVTLLQGNIPQDLKFSNGINQALRDYREALLSSHSDLTVTPETALPLVQQQLPDHYWQQLEAHFAQGSQAALIGMPLAVRREQGQMQYSNTAVALMPQLTPASTARYQYDKHHLVPFGEFVPTGFHWFVQMMNIPLSDFTRGDVSQQPFNFRGERIAPNICYEDLFGEELARNFADPDRAPTLMVNLSNIAWFGDTVAIDQHLNISRMRALELGRPMLRATNTGATAIINAQGVVTHRLPSAVKGALTAEVFGMHGPITPYARWVSVWGLWPLVVLALLTLAVVAAMAHVARHGQRRFGP